MNARYRRDNARSPSLYMTDVHVPNGRPITWRRLAPIVRAARHRRAQLIRVVVNSCVVFDLDGRATDIALREVAAWKVCTRCRVTRRGQYRPCSDHQPETKK